MKKAQSLVLALVMILSIALGSLIHAETVSAAASGFYINGTTLYDANGNPFVMRGVNHAYTWYQGQESIAIPAIAKTGANCVRLVLSDGQQWTKTTLTQLQSLISLCEANKLVAIVEIHDATGFDDISYLNNAVNYWVEMKSALIGHEKSVILNIANEWYGTWSGSGWASGYTSAIPTIRNAGIKNAMIIDCAGWGQYPQSIFDYGKTVAAADSLKNTMFAIHMYEYAGGTSSTIKSNIDSALNIGYPVCIEEFGAQHTNGDVDEATIMSYSQQKGVGYLGWSWYGNSSSLSFLDIATNMTGSSYSSWGNTLINGLNGIKATSKICSVFSGSTTTDKTAPSSPTNLACSSKTSTSVSLTWTAATDNVGVTGYDIYNGSTIVGSNTSTSYTLTGLTALKSYSITVKAKDAAGNVSASSSSLSVTTSSDSTSSIVLDNFENTTNGWTGLTLLAGPWSVTEWKSNGSYSLKGDVNLVSGSKYELYNASGISFSGKTTLKAVVSRASWGTYGTAMTARLYVKTGSGYTWYNGSSTSISSSATTLSFTLSSVANLGDIKEYGVEFTAGNSGNSGNSSVYVDYVTIQ